MNTEQTTLTPADMQSLQLSTLTGALLYDQTRNTPLVLAMYIRAVEDSKLPYIVMSPTSKRDGWELVITTYGAFLPFTIAQHSGLMTTLQAHGGDVSELTEGRYARDVPGFALGARFPLSLNVGKLLGELRVVLDLARNAKRVA